MRIVYNFVILTYTSLIHIFSLFDSKAGLWVRGRKNWYSNLTRAIRPGGKTVWGALCFAWVSLNRGGPLIELIKKENPDTKILLTFFSPSGLRSP